MDTNILQNDMQAFYDFLGRRSDSGQDLTPEQSVREFCAYQEELQKFLRDSESAFAHAQNDEGRELDIDAMMDRVAKRLAEEGSAP